MLREKDKTLPVSVMEFCKIPTNFIKCLRKK